MRADRTLLAPYRLLICSPAETASQFCNDPLQDSELTNQRFSRTTCTRIAYSLPAVQGRCGVPDL